ncbi:MAG: sulfite reductase [Deltaproteobacteria bacterium]|nr:MAG: sulfite reductase [Deltaproteobacteria bacterium]
MEWQPEAEKKLSRSPSFIRKKIRTMVEAEASSQGALLVTVKHLLDCREKFFAKQKTSRESLPGYSLETCLGSDGCPNNLIDDYQLIEQLETLLASRDLPTFFRKKVTGPPKFHHQFSIVIAGCPNACSRPQIADLGIIGVSQPRISEEACSGCGICVENCPDQAITLGKDGLSPTLSTPPCLSCGRCIVVCPTETIIESTRGFRLLVGGKLGRHPQLGQELPGIYSARETLTMAKKCLDIFQQHNQYGERFGEVLKHLEPTNLLPIK